MKKSTKLQLYDNYNQYGGMPLKKLKELPKEVRDHIVKRDKALRKKLKIDRSKSWIIPRHHICYEPLYMPYRKVLEL